MISEDTRKLLILSKIKGVGKKTLNDLAQDNYFFKLSISDWLTSIPKLFAKNANEEIIKNAIEAAEYDISEAKNNCDFILSIKDDYYPALLKNTKDKPAIIFVRGDPKNFSTKSIAIVGTRDPSEHGIITAERLTDYFSNQGWQIVSGLALGIDTIAHKTTIKNSCSTVAVLAQGLDKIYPKENKELTERILENNGVLVTEYSYNSTTFRSNFVERDRIQAALARGVLMVQSDETGGSWHASRAALNYGRNLLIPIATKKDIFIDYPKSRGNRVMMDGSDLDKTKILHCSISDLDKLFIIKSKEDYSIAEKLLTDSIIDLKEDKKHSPSNDLLS
ncbi:MAG: DNA-processing protein DprA [Comamonas sp.]|uniref:DNA-processing protein DprA n=1 Tax=Comamonas sp. TaxID=34028 RepID=UPI002FC8EA0C